MFPCTSHLIQLGRLNSNITRKLSEVACMNGRRSLSSSKDWHGTTILCIRKDDQVCMIGDGQVSMVRCHLSCILF